MRRENSKIKERRRNRKFVPAIYFILELIFMWLVLTILQLSCNPIDWELWSQVVMVLFASYALLKMLHIYKRQKDYDKVE
jgi:hypothetical protein